MSFLDDLSGYASSAGQWLSSSGMGANLAKTALLGIALNQMTKSVNKSNDQAEQKPTVSQTREQLVPDTENKIPVIYGSAFVRGIITDAYLASDKKTMYYCIALCEKTGTLLSTSAASQFTIDEVYRNGLKLAFQSDGFTVASGKDDNGETDTKMNGLIKVYPFAGSSANPINITGYSSGNTTAASGIMPHWTANHQMNDLVFLIVRTEYSKENDVTQLGDIVVKVKNTMTLPGDCLYDYMTNTRYGAGIPAEEIYSA